MIRLLTLLKIRQLSSFTNGGKVFTYATCYPFQHSGNAPGKIPIITQIATATRHNVRKICKITDKLKKADFMPLFEMVVTNFDGLYFMPPSQIFPYSLSYPALNSGRSNPE